MPQRTFHYKKEDITITWRPDVCIHSTICFKGLGEVFDPRRRPWIDLSKADTERIIDQVKQCPSGALSYTIDTTVSTEGAQEAAGPVEVPSENKVAVECLKDGPYLIKETIVIRSADGSEEVREGNTALCRCGASSTKPFCDGSHRKVGFTG